MRRSLDSSPAICPSPFLIAVIPVWKYLNGGGGCPPQTTACLSNLRAIEGAKVTWALEYGKDKTDVPNDSDLFGASLYIREKLICPLGGIYTLEGVDKSPVSSIHGDINSYNRNPVTGSPRP